MLLGYLVMAMICIPIIVGCILFIVGLVIFIIEKAKQQKSTKGWPFMAIGASVVVGTVVIVLLIVGGSKLKKQFDYNNIPNRVELSDFDAQSFSIGSDNYVLIDYLNNYKYESFDDTEYNVAVNTDNYRPLRVSKSTSIKIYSAYSNSLYVNEKDKSNVWDNYKDSYTSEYSHCYPNNTTKKSISIDDMDLYLELWRDYESYEKTSYQYPTDDELECFDIDCTSSDGLSDISLEIGRDSSDNYYYAYKAGRYAVPIDNNSYILLIDGLDLE